MKGEAISLEKAFVTSVRLDVSMALVGIYGRDVRGIMMGLKSEVDGSAGEYGGGGDSGMKLCAWLFASPWYSLEDFILFIFSKSLDCFCLSSFTGDRRQELHIYPRYRGRLRHDSA